MPYYDGKAAKRRIDTYESWLKFLLGNMPEDLIEVLPEDMQEWWTNYQIFDGKV